MCPTIEEQLRQITEQFADELPDAMSEKKSETHEIVSKVGVLLGVSKKFFEDENNPLKQEIFQELEQIEPARKIRNLCILRTSIETHYRDILDEFRFNLKNIKDLPEYIPQECLEALEQDGLSLYKPNHRIQNYVIDINQYIQQGINACKKIFPTWINWDYIRSLFIMPNGSTEQGIKQAAHQYYSNKSDCPYQVYINWNWKSSDHELGNILYNDKKFLKLLYAANNDHFSDISKVTDVSESTTRDLFQFSRNANSIAIVVDCENSDPFKFYAVLDNLKKRRLLDKVSKIILCDDSHTTTAWKLVNKYAGDIPVDHEIIERIKADKSLVDPKLVAKVCREVYKNNVDSIVLFASDSDYWGMISEVSEAAYLVMIENGKCGPDIKNAMFDAKIPYSYIDDFCTGNTYNMKVSAVLSELQQRLDEQLSHINLISMFEESLYNTRAEMSPDERKRFYARYIKSMRLTIAPNGDISLNFAA